MRLGSYSTDQSNVTISNPFAYLTIIATFTHGSTPGTAAALIAAFRTDLANVFIDLRSPQGKYLIPTMKLIDLAEITAGWSDRFIQLENTAAACTAKMVIPIGVTGCVVATSGSEYKLNVTGLPGSFTIALDVNATPVDTLSREAFKLVPVSLKVGQQSIVLRDDDIDVAIALPNDVSNLQMQGHNIGDYNNAELKAFVNDVAGIMYNTNKAPSTDSQWIVVPFKTARKFLVTMVTEGNVYLVRRVIV